MNPARKSEFIQWLNKAGWLIQGQLRPLEHVQLILLGIGVLGRDIMAGHCTEPPEDEDLSLLDEDTRRCYSSHWTFQDLQLTLMTACQRIYKAMTLRPPSAIRTFPPPDDTQFAFRPIYSATPRLLPINATNQGTSTVATTSRKREEPEPDNAAPEQSTKRRKGIAGKGQVKGTPALILTSNASLRSTRPRNPVVR